MYFVQVLAASLLGQGSSNIFFLEDCSVCCLRNRDKRFHVVDLDPYGTPAPFLDAAVQAVANGGLLMVTATDLRVLCGDLLEVGYSKYGVMPLKCPQHKELALRLVLHAIESHANRYKRHIVPLLSVCAEFYIRLFVRVYYSPSKVKESASKQSYVYTCVGCHSCILQPVGVITPTQKGYLNQSLCVVTALTHPIKGKKYQPAFGPTAPEKCEHCNGRFRMGGPVWSACLHDTEFVGALISTIQRAKPSSFGTYKRMIGQLTVIQEELSDPLYVITSDLAKTLKTPVISILDFR
ncbi:hypothetical protein Zmor_012106 [Zophobas morio]|uniref:tRNA (guanine(26)-N(2))-dimethyltransferase n=1 Tax=Zophobas morio TaxID=2755281 RepID=A0AA38LYI7_9CUCU|nr:hypothetical protein Zmor_012106 [Zophobas morio]